ncbi:MAG: autotransporter-associated beta strand repeat-containing protein, partial [Thermoguttaceae bacterium]|nr:autotransporter-associated beta strand repeat-containing protein [Thermoguttaceae bacterium]
MYFRVRLFSRRRWGYLLAAMIIGSGALPAWAGTFTWTGNGDQYWSTPANWSGSQVPVSAADTIISFDVMTNPGTSTTPLNQNIANPLQLNELTFGHNADVSYYISGNPLRFVANGTTQPMFRNYGWYDKYFYNEIQVPAGTTLRLINDTWNMLMNGVISGAGTLRMEAQGGGGEWHLYAANTYTGGTIYNGTTDPNQAYCRLAVYASGGLGTGTVTLNGGNISTVAQAAPRAGLHFMTTSTSFSNNFLLQADSPIFASATGISLSGNVDLSTRTLYLRGTGSATLSGTVSGSGSITKLDTGTWTLSGNNTYTGATTVSAGTLLLGHPNALGTATSTVQLGDTGTGNNNIALLTDVWTGQGYYVPFAISRNIAVNNVGAGTVTIGSNAAGAGAGYWVEFQGTITLNNKDVRLKGTNSDRTTFTGKITGTGNVYVDGPNRITWSGTNDFVGNVFITAGTLQVHGTNIPDGADVTVASGATLRIWSASETINALNGAGFVQVGGSAGTFTIGAGNGSGTFSGTLRNEGTGVLALVKTGTGTQTLSGPLQHTGGTTVNGGTLVLAQPGVSFPSSGSTGQFSSAHTVTINTGGTLRLDTSWVTGDGLQNKA